MGITDKILMLVASRAVLEAEQEYLEIRKTLGEIEGKLRGYNDAGNPQFKAQKKFAATVFASYIADSVNKYYSARKSYYESKFNTTDNAREKRRISSKIHRTPRPTVWVAILCN